MFCLLLEVDIKIMGTSSLKEKRSVVKTIINKMQHNFNISISQIDYADKWQRTKLGISAVGSSKSQLQKLENNLINHLYSYDNIQVIEIKIDYV